MLKAINKFLIAIEGSFITLKLLQKALPRLELIFIEWEGND